MTQLQRLERELRRAAQSPDVRPPQLAHAAGAAGLLDVAYAKLDSRVGTLLLAATPVGLVRIAYLDDGQEDSVLAEIAARVSPRVLSAPHKLDRPRRAFELALDRQLISSFGRRVLEATAAIPYGSVSTYQEVAAVAGSPRGSRAAGNALGANPLPIVLPCHRVLRSGGALGGYTGGLDRKRTLLAIEGGQSPLALA